MTGEGDRLGPSLRPRRPRSCRRCGELVEGVTGRDCKPPPKRGLAGPRATVLRPHSPGRQRPVQPAAGERRKKAGAGGFGVRRVEAKHRARANGRFTKPAKQGRLLAGPRQKPRFAHGRPVVRGHDAIGLLGRSNLPINLTSDRRGALVTASQSGRRCIRCRLTLVWAVKAPGRPPHGRRANGKGRKMPARQVVGSQSNGCTPGFRLPKAEQHCWGRDPGKAGHSWRDRTKGRPVITS